MSSRSDREVLAFYGHHRCGSSWISALLEAACSKLGLRFRQVYDHRMFGDDLPGFVARESVDVLVYMNADWTHAKTLKQQRAFHVIRDPRDVLVSAYYSHRYSHPTDYWTELIEHRDVLEDLTLDDGLLAEVDCRRLQFREMSEWDYEAEGVLELRFEELVATPEAVLSGAFAHLGLVDKEASGRLQTAVRQVARVARGGIDAPLTHREFNQLVEDHRFERLSGGRQPGVEDVRHHYRRGSPGEWRTVLQDAHLAALEQHFPGLVARLGYSTPEASVASTEPSATT